MYKPGSVPAEPLGRHGCLPFIYSGSRLPALSVYPPASGEQPSSAGIHDLSAHVAYPLACHHGEARALTPHFHPYRLPRRGYPGGYFLLRFKSPRGAFPLGSMVLCAARTFLPRSPAGGKPFCSSSFIVSSLFCGASQPRFCLFLPKVQRTEKLRPVEVRLRGLDRHPGGEVDHRSLISALVEVPEEIFRQVFFASQAEEPVVDP